MPNGAFLNSTAKNLVHAFYISAVDFLSSYFVERVKRIKTNKQFQTKILFEDIGQGISQNLLAYNITIPLI